MPLWKMNRIEGALRLLRMCYQSAEKYPRRALRYKTMGLIHHDQILNHPPKV